MIMKSLLAGTALFASVGLAAVPAKAYTILDPGSTVAGKSIADWTAEWWTWIAQSPADQNPVYDPNGAWANQDNNGPVFFVAAADNATLTRNFTVPAGRPLLVPMLGHAWIGWPPDTEAIVDPALDGAIANDDTSTLFAVIDGQPVANPENYFEKSDFFSAGIANAGTVVTETSYFGGSAPVGADLYPSRAAGWWIMIDDLSPGAHTLQFGGAAKDGSYAIDVTANITVGAASVTEPASLLLLGVGVLGLLALRRHLLPFA